MDVKRVPNGKKSVKRSTCERSMTSKMSDMVADIWMTSPDMRQSFLLSSSTVFMFSIQTASTGPSNTTHCRSGSSLLAICLWTKQQHGSNNNWYRRQWRRP